MANMHGDCTLPEALERQSRSKLPANTLRKLYRAMLLPRMVEERMLLLLRQGYISKWFSGIGQEAVSAGATLALEADEFVLPLHRNLGVFLARGVPLQRLFAQFQGKQSGFTRGRDRSFHFGSLEHRIVGMISHLGPSLAVADGIALASRLAGEGKVALAFCGDGATSQGDVHEAMNLAAVWGLPVLFVIENNGYALSTPLEEQYRCERLSDRARGYGIEGITIDGNDVTAVFTTVRAAAERARSLSRPVVIECTTFRVRGHEEASGVKYVPPELIEAWQKKDPVLRFEQSLRKRRILNGQEIEQIRSEYQAAIEAALEQVLNEPPVTAELGQELADVYASTNLPVRTPGTSEQEMRFVDAVSDGLRQAMREHPRTVLMGQDIAGYGGVFKVTEGFLDEFGADRVRNTPLCESAVLGAGLGLAIQGWKPVIEMQFADFVSSGFTQVVNNLAKTHYRWGQPADVVVRLPAGGGTSAGPFHSQTMESWFGHTPGLKVYYPAFPEDAKGLLIRAIEEPNPVMFFEHKLLYRRIRGPVPEGYYTIPEGEARIVTTGSDATIVTYGLGVHWALNFSNAHPELSLEILDLRTLVPLDRETIARSISKTNRVLVLTEACATCGFAGEIAAWIAEHCFESLDAPVKRCASLDTPIPFAASLESNYLAESRLEAALQELLDY